MYIPKVGDVIKAKGGSGFNYVIMGVVGNIISYVYLSKTSGSLQSPSINVTNSFESKFPESTFDYPKEKFMPKKGDRCYYPLYDYSNDTKYSVFEWGGAMGINRQHDMLANGLLFATEAEAVEARDKMIKALA